jgi:hypothetical protein
VAFDQTGSNVRVTACSRCGAVTVVESIVDEPHPNDVQCVGNVVVAVDADALSWLSSWPRLTGDYRDYSNPIYIGASVRALDEATLVTIEERERAAQKPLSGRDRLLRAGVPKSPAPALPRALARFGQVFLGLALDGNTPYEELLPHVLTFARFLALDVLSRRPDFEAETVALVRSDDLDRRALGATIVSALGLATPSVSNALERWIDRASDAEPSDMHLLLHTIGCLGRSASSLIPALDRLAERLGNADYYLHKRIVDLANRHRL